MQTTHGLAFDLNVLRLSEEMPGLAGEKEVA